MADPGTGVPISSTHVRTEAAGENHSGTGRSQQRVRDWIKTTEDNLTSSGVSEADESVTSQNENADHTTSREQEQQNDSSLLNQESWDRFQTVPRDEQWGEPGFTSFLRFFKVVWIIFLFIVVLVTGVTNKLALLTLTSAVVTDGKADGSDPTPTMLLLALCFPYLCHMLTYSARSMFGSTHWPSLRMTITVLFLELCHTGGMCLLLFRILPRVDLMRALIILTSVYVTPSLLNVVTTLTNRLTSGCRRVLMTLVAMIAFLVQLGGVGLATYQGFLYNSTETVRLEEAAKEALSVAGRGLAIERLDPDVGQNFVMELPLALVLVSVGFWENFIDGEFRLCGYTVNMWMWKARLNLVRQRLYILVSAFKVTVSILLAVLFIPGFTFTMTFSSKVVQSLTSDGTTNRSDPHLEMYGPLYAMLVSGILCSYMSGLACKLCVQVVGFALPMTLVTPVSALLVMMECQFGFLSVPSTYYTWVCPRPPVSLTSWSGYHVIMLAVMWLSQSLLTCRLWTTHCGRMEKIQRLFITPMRCGILTEQTLIARRRIRYPKLYSQGGDGEGTLFSEDVAGRPENTPLIYACATMWHETRTEMVQLMKSIFRMDIDRSARFIAQKYYNIKDPEYYDFEAHIFFDDAMELAEEDILVPNSFVATLMGCLDDAISAVHERPTSLGDPVRTPTPYGGRLTWVLPGGTPLVVHLKNKNKIRHKKRWSQVMYMYYLLGFKILANSSQTDTDQGPDFDSVSGISKQHQSKNGGRAKLTSSELRRRRTAAHFTRSVIFNYVPEEVQVQAENTYILALDGDVDFKPDAVRLLLDRMKKNTKVGAACGRIHPTGSGLIMSPGPIVWYQKFEYAIGHWLQKATEHVFGCVLCAPGCFSLFRGSALMDDNVIKTYATRSSQATHYVQYDQGEDRWLSTLLLQQGYRIDYTAAADALTHAPETFSEFFNQRRRWGPSTLANVIDVIGDWRTSVRLNDNLSTIYMVYQCMMLVSTVLGPATIVLLMAGSFRVVFKISVVESYTLTLIVPALYMAVCLYAKPSLQLKMGAALSAMYALVMTIVLVGTVGTAIDGSITSPNVLFLFTVITIFIVSGFMHPQELYCVLPGVLYLIMIPAGYLVLTIYFLTNLHVVSWGTRETQSPNKANEPHDKNTGGQRTEKERGVFHWLGFRRIVKEIRKLIKQVQESVFHKIKQDKELNEASKSRTNQLLEKLVIELRRDRAGLNLDKKHRAPSEINDHSAVSAPSPLNPVATDRPTGFLTGNLSTIDEQNTLTTGLDDHEEGTHDNAALHVENDIQEDSRVRVKLHQRSVDDDVTNESWLTSGCCGEGPVTELQGREAAFWRQLIGAYLYPLHEEKAYLDKVNAELKALRNSVVFGFTMISAIWVALTMQLEVLQNDLQAYLFIHIARFNSGPALRFQPLGLFFLASFAFILITQFFGMFSHRWGTLLHTLSITDVGIGGTENEQQKVRDAIMQVVELQRLRNIELEPEPDYDEPLPDYNNDEPPNVGVTNPVYNPDADDVSYPYPGNTILHLARVDDAISLAASETRPTFDFGNGSHSGWRPYPYVHGHLVRSPPERGNSFRQIMAERRGPLGDFTLQRAFEKRFRNEIGSHAHRMQTDYRPTLF